MFIDTHCHLNFKAFQGGEEKIIRRARDAGVGLMIVPGADLATSEKAVDISRMHEQVFAVVGIHPHHAAQYIAGGRNLGSDLSQIDHMLAQDKVVGVGEIGLDRHSYVESRYGPEIVIDDALFVIQKTLFIRQLQMAAVHNKSVVIHNRETVGDIISLLDGDLQESLGRLANRIVLHCCESDLRLLDLAKRRSFFIGVDGDVTYSPEKQAFIREVPLEMLVLETDSPYLLPEPLRSEKRSTNQPANIPLIAAKVAEIKHIDVADVERATTLNAMHLFGFPQSLRHCEEPRRGPVGSK